METKFFVAESYRYRESKSWEYKMVGMYADLATAKQAYHSRLAAIIKATNDFASVILYDNFGRTIATDYVDTHVEEEAEVEVEG
jgi:hypothetical protein